MTTPAQAIRLLEESGCAPNVIEHCKEVASLAVEIAEKAKAAGNNVNSELVEVGALLHDLGRCRTHGIAHAVEGFELAKNKGVEPEVAEIIKRHILKRPVFKGDIIPIINSMTHPMTHPLIVSLMPWYFSTRW